MRASARGGTVAETIKRASHQNRWVRILGVAFVMYVLSFIDRLRPRRRASMDRQLHPALTAAGVSVIVGSLLVVPIRQRHQAP
jgi:hypothetical protein